MANDVTLTWDLPTERVSGFPLNPTDIKEMRVELGLAGTGSHTPVGTVLPADAQQFQLFDQDIGEWEFRLVTVDTANRESSGVLAPFTVIDVTPPGDALNVNVTIS
jgi:hypothetical protein